jgi:hypothetical protein
MINQLIQVISEEALLFEDFLQLLDRQKQMLVANDAEGLNEVTAAQQKKLIESQKLHRRREEIVAAIKATNAIDGDVTITRLLKYADEGQAERLQRLRETILSLNDSILEARNTNAMLLNRSREYIARTMSMLSRINNPDNTYDRRGASSSDHATVAVDRRI